MDDELSLEERVEDLEDQLMALQSQLIRFQAHLIETRETMLTALRQTLDSKTFVSSSPGSDTGIH